MNNINLDFSNGHWIQVAIAQGRYDFDVQLDNNGTSLSIKLSKSHMKEFLQKLLDDDYFEIDENNELKVSDI